MKRVAIVSPKEIAKDQGKPLSKYERNMMIFDWLHTVGEILITFTELIKFYIANNLHSQNDRINKTSTTA